MSSIDDALSRIQEIMSRIRSIQNLARDPRGVDEASAPTQASAQQANAQQASAGTSTPTPAEFAKLLEQALAAQTQLGGAGGSGDLSASNLLSGGAAQGALGSLLGLGSSSDTGSASAAPLGDYTNALQSYQNSLLEAIRQLAAEKAAPPAPANPAAPAKPTVAPQDGKNSQGG